MPVSVHDVLILNLARISAETRDLTTTRPHCPRTESRPKASVGPRDASFEYGIIIYIFLLHFDEYDA